MTKHILLFSFLYLFINPATSAQEAPLPTDLIVGDWVEVRKNTVWKFSDSKVFVSDKKPDDYYLVKGASKEQCTDEAYQSVFNSDQLVLVRKSDNHSFCYMIDGLNRTYLVLFLEESDEYLTFRRRR